MSKNRTIQRRPGVAFRTWFGAVAVLTTAALGLTLLAQQNNQAPVAVAAGVAVDAGAGEQNFVPIVTDPDGTDAKATSKNAAKAASKANPFTAVQVCAGYTEVKQLPVAGGTVHLTQRGNSFCVVTLKTTNIGTKTAMAAHISSKKDAGNFANYAGPVQYVPAAMECVTWGGSVGNSSTKGQFGDCGATPPPPPPTKANPYTAAKVCTGYTEVKRLTLNGGTVYLTKKGNNYCVVTLKTTNVGTKTPVSAELGNSKDEGHFANYAGPVKASPSGCFLFGGSVGSEKTDRRTDKYGTGCYPTKPAPAKANPFTATKVCAGYKEVKRLTVAGGTVHLTQRGNSYCVVTLKTTNVGTKSPVAAQIGSQRDAGNFANYAGPVRYTPAAQECVTWGGSVGGAKTQATFGSCGNGAPPTRTICGAGVYGGNGYGYKMTQEIPLSNADWSNLLAGNATNEKVADRIWAKVAPKLGQVFILHTFDQQILHVVGNMRYFEYTNLDHQMDNATCGKQFTIGGPKDFGGEVMMAMGVGFPGRMQVKQLETHGITFQGIDGVMKGSVMNFRIVADANNRTAHLSVETSGPKINWFDNKQRQIMEGNAAHYWKLFAQRIGDAQ